MRMSRQILLQTLEAISPGLATRETVDQSSCVCFKGGQAMAFNEEIATSAPCQLEVEGAVQAKPFIDLLSKLTEDDLDFEATDGELLVKGRSRHAGVRMEAEVLLPVDLVERPTAWIPIAPDFCEAIGIVQQCAGKDQGQFNLTCVHIHPDHIEACDNFQATRYPLKTGVRRPTLVRNEALRHIAGLGMTELGETKTWIHFKNPSGLTLSARRYLEEYPDLGPLLDVKGEPASLPGGLAEAIPKAEIFSADNAENNQIMVTFERDVMWLSSLATSGWYKERFHVKYEGAPFRFMIAPKLLLEIARRHTTCVITRGRLMVDAGRYTYVSCTGEVQEEGAKAKGRGKTKPEPVAAE